MCPPLHWGVLPKSETRDRLASTVHPFNVPELEASAQIPYRLS